ncbi:MAG: aliphatic sulfonate ABC transporter substrate-binding protein [Limimaricola soesokkakensis]|uniref:aliphatic sulfonate ABC transporter substrate-binding protein n=1 Tax=Limimaricola soesokkakensis TaxID=1343159 RepID=UPI004059AD9D
MTIKRTAFATVSVLVLAGPLSAQDLQEIRMGYIADYWGTSIAAIATDQGMWEKHGLDADLKVFTNGPIQVQALNAGSLDFAYIGPGALWLPASGQAKVIAPNALGYTDRVIAQEGIETIADLAGKKVGVPEGTSGDMLLRLALAKADLDLDAIEFISMDPSTIVTAFTSGQIDAAGIWYPFVDVIGQRVPGMTELASNEDFFPDIAFPSSFIVSDDMAGEEETIRRVVAVIKDANDYRLANPDEAVTITADFLNAPADPLRAESTMARMPTSAEFEELTTGGQVDNWFDTLADLYVQFGKIEDPLPASEFYLGELYAE